MKRRSFCQYVALSSVCFAGVCAEDWAFAENSNSSYTKPHRTWVVLYWMPYDNDLVRFGEPIIEMLANSTRDSEVAVVVQSDYLGEPQMRRRRIENGIVYNCELTSEDSSAISAFSAYLDWANLTYEADHWAVIVVGHGGRLNEISPDDHGVAHRHARTWMGVDQFADAVTNFNRATNGRIELLFFQNCNKAMLEVVYEARNCARYTLASQMELGAPNYYYEGFLNQLKSGLISGREAAIAIMNSERADMFHTLTLVDNQAVRRIPSELAQLVGTVLNSSLLPIRQSELTAYYYCGERHCDVLVLLDYLLKANSQDLNGLAEFSEFLNSSVVVFHKTGGEMYSNNPYRNTNYDKFCGLSLYLPENEEGISRYRSFAIYQEFDLVSFYKKIIASS